MVNLGADLKNSQTKIRKHKISASSAASVDLFTNSHKVRKRQYYLRSATSFLAESLQPANIRTVAASLLPCLQSEGNICSCKLEFVCVE